MFVLVVINDFSIRGNESKVVFQILTYSRCVKEKNRLNGVKRTLFDKLLILLDNHEMGRNQLFFTSF